MSYPTWSQIRVIIGANDRITNAAAPLTPSGKAMLIQGSLYELSSFNGRQVATLVNEVKQLGVYTVQWDAQGVATGVYLYRLQSGSYSETRKLVVLR